MTVLEIVRPGAVRMASLASDRDVVYIEDERPDRYRVGDRETGQTIGPDELLDAIFAADVAVTW